MKSNEMLSCELTPDGVLHVTAYRHGTDKVAADRFVFKQGNKEEYFALAGRREFANDKTLAEITRNEILPLLVEKFTAAFPAGLATRVVAGFCPMTIGGEKHDARDFQEVKL